MSSFNSLYEIQKDIKNVRKERFYGFQFSLWDSNGKGKIYGKEITNGNLSILFMRFFLK